MALQMMPVGGGGPGHVKGPNRQKLDTYLAGAQPQDIQHVIHQWTQVHTRIDGARRTLLRQKKVLESGDGGLSETSPTVVNAVSTFRQSASDLDTKATQVNDAIVQLQRVYGAVKAAIDWTQGKGPDPADNQYSDDRLPTSPVERPNPEDFENKLGQVKGQAKKNLENKQQQWHDAQTAITHNDQIALKHIHNLDQVFGDASTTVRKVTDAPSSTSPSGTAPGSSVPPPGSSPTPYAPPPGTAAPTPYKPPPGANQPPVYTPPPAHTPPHYTPPSYDPPPAYDPPHYDPPPNDGGRLDGGPTITPTGPVAAPPPTPTIPTTPGVPMPGGVPGGVPAPSVPGAPPVPVIGPLTAGALGGARPNLTVPEVGLGTTARAGGPGVLGRGARTGGMPTGANARGGARSAGGGAGRGRGAGARGARGAGGGAGGRGGRKKDRERGEDHDAWDDGSDWLDDEASGPSVLH